MNSKYFSFTLLLIVLIFFVSQNALAQVTVVLQQPSPYQFKVEQMWKVTLINPTNTTYRVYLKGTATELGEGLILDATTATFALSPGMKIINARELVPLNIKESNPKYSDVVTRIGGVPTGDYEICVAVINSSDNAVLGEMCAQSQVMNLTQIELLQPEAGAIISSSEVSNQSTRNEEGTFEERFIREMDKIVQTSNKRAGKFDPQPTDSISSKKISPGTREGDTADMVQRKIYSGDSGGVELSTELKKISPGTREGDTVDNESVRKDFSENRNATNPIFIFSWLPPVPIPPDVRITYTLRVKEIYGLQSPYDAIHSNPSVFVMEKIPTNIVQLPVAARRLLPGKSYAWAVTVFLNGVLLQESEARSFTIEENQSAPNKRVPLKGKATESLQRKIIGATSSKINLQPGDVFSTKIISGFPGGKTAINNYSASNDFTGNASSNFGAGFNRSSMNGNSMQSAGLGGIIPKLFSSFFGDQEFQGAESMGGSDEKSSVAPITLTGNAHLEYQYANPVSSFSEIPKNYFNANLNPGITLYGIPFSTTILYSSLQDSSRQNINSFRLNFDFESMRQGLASRLQNAVAEIEEMKSLKADEISKILNFSQAELDSAKGLSTDELAKLRNSGKAEIEEAKSLKANALDKIRNLSQTELESLKSFDPEEISNLRNPKNLTDNLQRYASISGAEKFFMSILSLGVGTNYPMYSEYTLSGVPVTGVNFEINPGIFYAAFTGSKNQRGIDNWSYNRSLYAGRIGLGKKEGTHLYFTGLYAKDDVNSIVLDSANNTLTPKANYVFGTEVKMNLFSDKLTLEGEGAVAVLTRDTRDAELEHKSIPNWVKKIVDPRISTSFDYSYSGKLAFNNDASATRLSLGIKMVGPGYTSLGVPNLRTDQFGYEAKLDQRFFERRVSVGSFFKRNNDNLIKWKRSTSTTTAYGINLGVNFPRIPFLRISYSPYSQKNDDVNPLRKIDNTTSVYSLMTGYSYLLGSLNSSTSFTFSGQQTKTVSGFSDYRANSFMVTEGVSLNIPLAFTASWGLIQTVYGLGESKINNIDLGANAQINDVWSIVAGMNFASEVNRNSKTGFYLNSNVSPIQGIGIDLRIERNVYTEQQIAFGDYREFIFSATLTAQW